MVFTVLNPVTISSVSVFNLPNTDCCFTKSGLAYFDMNFANNKVNMSTAMDTSVNNGECHSIMPKHPKMVTTPLTQDVIEDDIALYTLSISFVILDNKSPWK